MVIILLRHAKAVPSTGDLPDFERPLRPKGIKQCSALAEAIPDVLEFTEGIRPRIWCSPAYRTRQTLAYSLPWAQRMPNVATEDLPRYPDWLYLAESPRYQLEFLADGNDRPLLIIGHNNGISDWAHELTGGKASPLGTCHFIVLRHIGDHLSGLYQTVHRWEPPKFMD